jgi:F-type H+-transporting ATPase subunit gamma
METLQSLRNRIEIANELQSVVTTMKSMAAVNIRQYQQAVESLAAYNHTLEQGLQILLRRHEKEIRIAQPATTRGLGVVIFGSDQGLVGQFNATVVQHGLDEIDRLQVAQEDRNTLVIGQRPAKRLWQLDQPIEKVLRMPSSVSGITRMVQEILLHIDTWRTEKDIEQIVLFYNSPERGAAYHPTTFHLLPINVAWIRELRQREWPSRRLPMFRMEWDRLFATLIRHYFFVALFRAFAGSLASENASRLSSMETAEENIEDRLKELDIKYNRLRQTSITEELMDVIAGFQVLTENGTQ